jgi:hypothetical protein
VRSTLVSIVLITFIACARSPHTLSPRGPAETLAGCYRLEVGSLPAEFARAVDPSPTFVRLDPTISDSVRGERRLRAVWLPELRPRPVPAGASASERERAELRAQLDTLIRSWQYWQPDTGGDSVKVARGDPNTVHEVYRFAVRRREMGRPELQGTVTLYSDDITREGFPSAAAHATPVECPSLEANL